MSRSVWWLHPACAVGGFTGLIIILAHMLPATTYLTNWNTPKYLDESSLLLSLSCVACFVTGALLMGAKSRNHVYGTVTDDIDRVSSSDAIRKLFYISYFLTMFGYSVWTVVAVMRGLNMGVVIAILKGENGVSYTIREQYLGNISGITTCTQFGISTVVLAVLMGSQLSRWRTLVLFIPFGFLTIARTLLNSERLALVEVCVPFGVALIHALLNREKTKQSVLTMLKHLPLVGFATLFVVFSIFEYFRSWATFYAGGDEPFWQFAASRLLGYYVTALNNGACLTRYLQHPLGLPYITMSFLWKIPLLKDVLDSFAPSLSDRQDYFAMLSRVANPEFNNAGGLMLPFIDLGTSGGLLYWFAAGLACGLLYRLFRRNNAWGLCLYPFAYISLLEVPRGLHWADGRSFPAFCFLALSAFIIHNRQSRVPLFIADAGVIAVL